MAIQLHYDFPDPAKAAGTQEQVMEQFHEVREMIRKYVRNFVNENLNY